jgi:hypothetical protein
LYLNKSNLKLSNTQVELERGRSVYGIRGNDSDVIIDNGSRITPGSGTMESVGLSFTNSLLKMVDGKITGEPVSRLNRGIVMRGGQLLFQDSEIDLTGTLGVVLIQTSATDYLILGSRFFSGPSQEYSYLLRMTDGEGRVINNIFRQAGSRDSTGLLLTRGGTRIFNNTLITAGGSLRTEGIKASGDLELVNTILIKEGAVSGTALVFEGPDLILTANCFNSWPVFLQEAGKAFTSLESVNLSDGNSVGGPRDKNIDEEISRTFIDPSARIPRLSRDSNCVNSGITLLEAKETATDAFKNPRPNPVTGTRPLYDIGAEEYSP